MFQYTIRRILSSLPVILGVLLLTFILARIPPGDPCRSISGEKATQAACDIFNEQKGLNKPMPVQLLYYIGDLAKGDLGNSLRFNRPITDMLIERLPLTIELGVGSLIIAIFIGIPFGILSALRRNSLFDLFTMIAANLGVSVPIFVLGLLFKYLFSVILKGTWFALPPSGRLSAGVVSIPFFDVWGWELPQKGIATAFATFISNFYLFNSLITLNGKLFFDAVAHLMLPWIALSSIPLAMIARMTRSAMIEVLGLDYVRTARSKGLTEAMVTMTHAFRNAALPVVTITGLQLGTIFSGAILTESIFGLAGVGLALYEGITARDFPIVQGFVIIIAIGYVVINLLVDLSYAFIDPRIRLE